LNTNLLHVSAICNSHLQLSQDLFEAETEAPHNSKS